VTDLTTAPDDDSPRAAGAAAGPSGAAGWARLVVGSLCQSVVATLVFFALWAALPALLGWQPTTVSSGSMMPRLHVGDVAVARPLSGPPVLQQVLLFDDPDHPGRLRLHRFVRVDDQGQMVTRGDANAGDDSSPVSPEDVRGVAVLRVPAVALPIVWLREGQWFRVALAAAGLVLLLAGSRLHRTPPTTTQGEDTGGGVDGGTGSAASGRHASVAVADADRTGRRQPSATTRALLAVVGIAGLLGTTGVVAAAPAWARYASSTSNPASSYNAAPYYRCDGPVLAQSPYLYYELDETSGATAADSSGNGRAGTFTGGTSAVASSLCPGSPQIARNLNGSTGYITTPTQRTAPDVFTVQTWFKTTTKSGGRIIGFGSARTGASTSFDRHVYMTNAGKLVFGVQTSSARNTVISADAYNDGSWHLVTASLSTAGMRLYVDDALVANRAATTTGLSYTGYWRVGYDSLSSWASAPTSAFFGGTVKGVAVYPTALSVQTVAAIYATG